jgi:hypothetical protein
MLLAQAIETLRAVGLDLPGLLNSDGQERENGRASHPPANVPASARAALDELQSEVDTTAGGRSTTTNAGS